MVKKAQNCINEFNCLYRIIENDNQHKLMLDPINTNCRYQNIATYKGNRINLRLQPIYINASWIHMPQYNYFIATQGPMPHTIESFWTMCYEQNVTLIIMLCNLKENNVEKCSKYWDIRGSKMYDIKQLSEKEENGICIRSLEVNNKIHQIVRSLTQIQLLCWDDHTALNANYFHKIISLINFVDKYRNNKPVVVHCSAGVGRTGTFICMYNLYHEIMKQIYVDKTSNEIIFSIFNLVRKMKEMRIYSVENVKQFSLLYDFAHYLLYYYNSKKV